MYNSRIASLALFYCVNKCWFFTHYISRHIGCTNTQIHLLANMDVHSSTCFRKDNLCKPKKSIFQHIFKLHIKVILGKAILHLYSQKLCNCFLLGTVCDSLNLFAPNITKHYRSFYLHSILGPQLLLLLNSIVLVHDPKNVFQFNPKYNTCVCT